MARYLVEAAAPFADEAFVDEAGNAVARFGTGGRTVTFLGHIDTVPGEVPVRLEGDRLYGRGAVDAKGPFCAALAAACRLPDAARERLSLRLVGAVEEEAPSSRGARHAVAAYPRPDLLVVGEPSGWDAVTLGYKGRLVIEVEAAKESAHTAGEASSAADDALEACAALRTWAGRASGGGDGVFDRVQFTVQALRSSGDGLEQRAAATVGLRLPPAWPPARVEEALGGLALPPSVSLAFAGREVAVRGPRDTPLTRAFRVAIREQGGRPGTKVKTGTSDMNVVAPHWPVPTLAYGPGDAALDHTPHEHVSVEEYGRAVAVLLSVLTRLAG